MSEHGDPGTWAAWGAAGTFLGAVLSALGVHRHHQRKSPQQGNNVEKRLEAIVLAIKENDKRIAVLETERLHSDADWKENRKVLSEIFRELKTLSTAVTRLTTLAERER